ncbi:hypothetical protein BJ165DRAFT_1397664 [Panaeolus papilionaceus]|nr:hypothetical protein BJ165DRAFT_1397664 [Panaeolus papilionaceus]
MSNFSLYGAPPFSEVSYGLRMNGPGPISSLVHNFNGVTVFAYAMPCRFNHACRTKLSAVYRRAGTRIVVEGSFEMNSFGLNISCIIDGKDVGFTPPDSLVLHRRANSVPFCDARDLGHYTSTNGTKVVINFSGLPYLITEELAPGMHRLEVTYVSTSGRPLAIHHLAIQDAISPSANASAPAPSQTPSGKFDAPQTQSRGIAKSAVIAISVNVAVAVLVVTGLLVFLWRRRRHKSIKNPRWPKRKLRLQSGIGEETPPPYKDHNASEAT